jgi:hypothetical protein
MKTNTSAQIMREGQPMVVTRVAVTGHVIRLLASVIENSDVSCTRTPRAHVTDYDNTYTGVCDRLTRTF